MLEQALAQQTAKIGSEIGVSDWVLVDQARIDAFADVTEDHQFIHVDPEKAAETPFGATIAHGFLTLSLASKLAVETLGTLPGQTMGVNYGLNKVRFINPVCSGDRIRGRFVLRDVGPRDAASLVQTYKLTIEIEDKDTPALVAEWLGMARFDG